MYILKLEEDHEDDKEFYVRFKFALCIIIFASLWAALIQDFRRHYSLKMPFDRLQWLLVTLFNILDLYIAHLQNNISLQFIYNIINPIPSY